MRTAAIEFAQHKIMVNSAYNALVPVFVEARYITGQTIVGILLLIVGIAALALSLGADVLGVGGNSSVFGPKQIAGTIGGIAMAFVGLFLVLKSKPAESLAS